MIDKDCGHSVRQGGKEVNSLTSGLGGGWCTVMVPFIQTGEPVGWWGRLVNREELKEFHLLKVVCLR